MSGFQAAVLTLLFVNVFSLNVRTKDANDHQWLQQQTQVWVKPVIPKTTVPSTHRQEGCGSCKDLESNLAKLQKSVDEMEKLKGDIEELKKRKEDIVSCQIGTSSNHGGMTLTKPQSYKSAKVWFKKQFSNAPTVICALRHVVFGNDASNVFVFAENVTIDGFSLTYFWDKPKDKEVDMSHMKASWIACEEPEMKYGRILPVD